MPALTRAGLRTELKDRGHNYGTTGWDARLDAMLNFAARDILLGEDWRQRLTTATLTTGTAGATLALPGTVRQVWLPDSQGGAVLDPISLPELREDQPGQLALAGTPTLYYLEDAAAVTKIRTWPSAGATQQVTVEYFQRACWVTAGTPTLDASGDTSALLGDGIFDEAVLLTARVRVLEDSDELDLAEGLELQLARELGRLKDNELTLAGDEPATIKQTRAWY